MTTYTARLVGGPLDGTHRVLRRRLDVIEFPRMIPANLALTSADTEICSPRDRYDLDSATADEHGAVYRWHDPTPPRWRVRPGDTIGGAIAGVLQRHGLPTPDDLQVSLSTERPAEQWRDVAAGYARTRPEESRPVRHTVVVHPDDEAAVRRAIDELGGGVDIVANSAAERARVYVIDNATMDRIWEPLAPTPPPTPSAPDDLADYLTSVLLDTMRTAEDPDVALTAGRYYGRLLAASDREAEAQAIVSEWVASIQSWANRFAELAVPVFDAVAERMSRVLGGEIDQAAFDVRPDMCWRCDATPAAAGPLGLCAACLDVLKAEP